MKKTAGFPEKWPNTWFTSPAVRTLKVNTSAETDPHQQEHENQALSTEREHALAHVTY